MGWVRLRQGTSDVHVLTLDAAGRLARRERPSCMGGVRDEWRSMQYEVALGVPPQPARVKGDIALPQGNRWTGGLRPRVAVPFFHMGWSGWVCWWRWVRAVSSARWRLRRARAPLATGRPCRYFLRSGTYVPCGRKASIPRPIKCMSGRQSGCFGNVWVS